MNKKELGKYGEDIACKFLIKLGYKIIERNYRFGKGEIDIIADDNGTLVFVEVKTRENLNFGPPELAVTKAKQNQIRKIASAYLYEKGINDTLCRMDVVAILLLRKDTPQINHLINAF